MQLPDGVSFHPRKSTLISNDASVRACLRIDTKRWPANALYSIRNRTFGDILPFIQGDWKHVVVPQPEQSTVYSGAEHTGRPKLPNLTIVPSLVGVADARKVVVLGSTMGHWHSESVSDCPVQEVYEFQSHGLLVTDCLDGTPELWVAQPGDKVAVPGACHMTLYNLGDLAAPLVTVDFANPGRNRADKSVVAALGPILLGYFDDTQAIFVLNRHYVDSQHAGAGGVRGLSPNRADAALRVVVPLRARLDVGALLHAELTSNPDVIGKFARLGLRIRKPTADATLPAAAPARSGKRLHFASSLVAATRVTDHADDSDGIHSQYPAVYRHFFPDALDPAPPGPGPAVGRGIAGIAADRDRDKRARIDLQPLNRPLVVVVEGAGEWVTAAYRKVFLDLMAASNSKGPRELAEGSGVSVFYADDGSWKPRPDWALEGNLQAWEVYLDKSDPQDLAIWRSLRPDVVIVVTPDFTHSTIARSWLRKSPLVLVEKPFDSRLANVDDLLVAAAQSRGTEILGLDHWLAYALPLQTHKQAIVEHLGGAVARVAFYMTEDRPIEAGRDRSLQFGLMLDLVPHMLALLTHFGRVSTIDDVQVDFAGQYRPLISARPGGGEQIAIPHFRNETACAFRFTFRDDSGNGYRIPCRAVVGKGFKRAVRYLEVTGRSGGALRLDLNQLPAGNPPNGYPYDALSFIEAAGMAAGASGQRPRLMVADPYDSSRQLALSADASGTAPAAYRVDRDRYRRLIKELIEGRAHSIAHGPEAVASALLLSEAREIVGVLDRFWRAMQCERPWREYLLGEIEPTEIN